MTDIQAVSRTRHSEKRWLRVPHYLFAQSDNVAMVSAKELPRIQRSMPLAFLPNAGAYRLVVLQGLTTGQNLCIDQQGRWLTDYVPAIYRGYPFQLARDESGEQLLCINEASGLVTSEGGGEAFFGEDGKPSSALAEVLDFLNHTEQDKVATAQACKVLQQHDLIEPWPVSIEDGTAAPRTLEGLFRVSETRLNALSAEALLEVRNAGALVIAYCQLLSMQNLQQLGKLQQLSAAASAPSPALHEDSGIISFENL